MVLNDPPVDPRCHSCFTRTPRCSWFWFPWFITVQKHTVMGSNLKLCFSFPRLLSSLSSTSGHQLQLFSLPLVPTLHSLCPWDTPFIYFLLNFSALRDSFPAVPGGTESTLGVSQRLAGVGKDARGAKLGVGLVWDGERGRGCLSVIIESIGKVAFLN